MNTYDKMPDWLRKEVPSNLCWTAKEYQEYLEKHPDQKDTLKYKLRWNVYTLHHNKIPISPTDDIHNFMSFDKALSKISDVQKRYPGETVGLGIGLFGPLCGIDIDHAIHDGKLAITAAKIMKLFKGAYMERSLSGTGVHIIFLMKPQKKHPKHFTKMNAQQLAAKGITDIGGLEFYQGTVDNRYLTLTGDVISCSENNYTVTEKTIKNFLDTYMRKPEPKAPQGPAPVFVSSDEEDRAWYNWATQKKPKNLCALASKIPTGAGGTESEDDLRLMTELAYWCNRNPIVMRAAFENTFYFTHKDRSHLDKWYSREDYRNKYTIEPALAACTKAIKVDAQDRFIYDPERKEIVRREG